MREILRNIARENMKKAGVRKINKKRNYGEKEGMRSYFAVHWKNWVNGNPHAKRRAFK